MESLLRRKLDRHAHVGDELKTKPFQYHVSLHCTTTVHQQRTSSRPLRSFRNTANPEHSEVAVARRPPPPPTWALTPAPVHMENTSSSQPVLQPPCLKYSQCKHRAGKETLPGSPYVDVCVFSMATCLPLCGEETLGQIWAAHLFLASLLTLTDKVLVSDSSTFKF